MAQIKKEVLALSEWLSFELEPNPIIDGPIRLRLKPINRVESIDHMQQDAEMKWRLGPLIIGAAADAVHDWDLIGLDGNPLPMTAEVRSSYLSALLGRFVIKQNGEDIPLESLHLGQAIFDYASNLENFLKN